MESWNSLYSLLPSLQELFPYSPWASSYITSLPNPTWSPNPQPPQSLDWTESAKIFVEILYIVWWSLLPKTRQRKVHPNIALLSQSQKLLHTPFTRNQTLLQDTANPRNNSPLAFKTTNNLFAISITSLSPVPKSAPNSYCPVPRCYAPLTEPLTFILDILSLSLPLNYNLNLNDHHLPPLQQQTSNLTPLLSPSNNLDNPKLTHISL